MKPLITITLSGIVFVAATTAILLITEIITQNEAWSVVYISSQVIIIFFVAIALITWLLSLGRK